MSKIYIALALALIALSCSDSNKKIPVSNESDYRAYLESTTDNQIELHEEIAFWTNKVAKEPRGFTFYDKLGGAYNKLFEETGKVNYLHQADSVFSISQRLTQGNWKVSSLLSRSSLAIKRHNFRKAVTYAVTARELTNQKFGPLLMQFDAEMELGNYQMAKGILQKNRRMDSFDYLVRLSKFKDYEGDLDSAIYYLERANDLILEHQKDRKLWAVANLGDMYGHAGRIEESYTRYLEALSIDPGYDYAFKGIAWVLYSHDGKADEAKQILKNLQAKTPLPDYYLPLAEISEYMGKTLEAESYKYLFLSEATKPKYDGMYNKYLIDLFIEKEAYEKALKLALEEVEKRPNPTTYDWLAWTLFHQGNTQEAFRIYHDNVEGQTFEPEAIYHMGMVYHAMNKRGGRSYLEESLEAAYELGPLVTSKIASTLKHL